MPSASKKFSCNDCQRTFQTRGALGDHCMARNHTFTGPGLACKLCAVTMWFISKRHLKSHIRAIHKPKRKAKSSRPQAQKQTSGPQVLSAPRERNPRTEAVSCNFCGTEFGSASAYAYHLQSGAHRASGHQVTQAVQTQGVVPPMVTTQSIGYETTTSIVEADLGAPNKAWDGSCTHLGNRNHTSLDQDLDAISPGTTSIGTMEVVPGPPLTHAELQASLTPIIVPMEVVPGPPLTSAELQASLIPIISPTVSIGHLSKPNTTVYVPDNLVHLSVPYACSTCAGTLRTVIGLNSPVHDPKAFFCPSLVVPALIQHLESGCSTHGLAGMDEVIERFGQLTAGISRPLTV